MSTVEFLVKLRDAAQQIADAANEQIETMAPSETKYNEDDFNKLFWENLQGSKGPFQRTSKKRTKTAKSSKRFKRF